DLVVREGNAAQRILYSRREDALPLVYRRHGGEQRGNALDDPGPFKRAVDESAIAPVIFRQQDRSTRRSSELIAPVLAAGTPRQVTEEVIGVEIVVAQIFPNCAVQFIRTGFQDRVDLAAGLGSELRGVITALYAEFH